MRCSLGRRDGAVNERMSLCECLLALLTQPRPYRSASECAGWTTGLTLAAGCRKELVDIPRAGANDNGFLGVFWLGPRIREGPSDTHVQVMDLCLGGEVICTVGIVRGGNIGD